MCELVETLFLCYNEPGLLIRVMQIQLDYFYFETHTKGDKIEKVNTLESYLVILHLLWNSPSIGCNDHYFTQLSYACSLKFLIISF